MIKQKRVALFGFGCVGQGLYQILKQQDSLPFDITKVCVKDPNKSRNLPPELLVFNKEEVLADEDIDIIVEAINDDDEAFKIVKEALKLDKTVISASKKMLAENLKVLTRLEADAKGTLLYESSTCGSIPIIRTLQDYFRTIKTESLVGILNGSSNFVLSKIFNNDLSYDVALKEAQDLGFAETDPRLDVGGFDASHKLSILAYQGFQTHIDARQIFKFGIDGISKSEIELAQSQNGKIKQVAILKRIGNHQLVPLVMPALVLPTSPLFNIEDEDNGVLLDNELTGLQLLQGKGAGSLPTGWALFSDLLAACYGYNYHHPLPEITKKIEMVSNVPIPIYLKCNSDEVIKTIDLEVDEDLSTNTRHRIVKGTVSLANLQRLVSGDDYEKVFLFLDLNKFMEQKQTSTENENKKLITVL